MAILVDEARWQWRGTRWAHLVSDASYDELHEFARGLGKRRLGFQGDHYDVDVIDRDRAVDLGALAVDSRTLVRRIRGAGLRNRLDKPQWVRVAAWPSGERLLVHELPVDFRAAFDAVGLDLTAPVVALFEDLDRQAVLVDLPPDVPVDASHPELIVGGLRVDGSRSIEMIVSR
ncbi:MAG: hypothetical protein DHS20C19_01450 [Acidimicrobiales bacterium]|nr:MAG: hypothetical protein DHS20C19_01450 [Acidimicrobiales bacterium]